MKVYITGDIHGNASKLSSKNFPDGKDLTKDDVVIILGDFGLIWSEYRTKEEDYWLKWLDDKPFTTCFLDGNHENHPILNDLPRKLKYGNEVGIAGHSIFHLRRGLIYKINGFKLLTIGGAHSHDREYREWGKSMWIQEEITEDDIYRTKVNLEKENYTVDYVLTHCAPVSKARGAMRQDQTRLWTPDGSEELLQVIYDLDINYITWFCGHYHSDHGPTYDGKFECIDTQIIPL